jgi:hypothetical protein
MAGIFTGNNSADGAAWLNFDEWQERNHEYSFVPNVQDIGLLPYFLICRSVFALFTAEVRNGARSYQYSSQKFGIAITHDLS